MRPGARFCLNCGAPALARPAVPKPVPGGGKTARIILFVLIGLVVVGIIAGVAGGANGGVANGEYASPAYSGNGLETNYAYRGEYVSFHGNKMSVYYVAGAYVLTGTYEISDGYIWLDVDEADYEMCSSFFNTSGGYIVFEYSKDGKDIWLDGIKFYKE